MRKKILLTGVRVAGSAISFILLLTSKENHLFQKRSTFPIRLKMIEYALVTHERQLRLGCVLLLQSSSSQSHSDHLRINTVTKEDCTTNIAWHLIRDPPKGKRKNAYPKLY